MCATLLMYAAGQRGCVTAGAVHNKTGTDSAGVSSLQPHQC
jgi:hypothetical protein